MWSAVESLAGIDEVVDDAGGKESPGGLLSWFPRRRAHQVIRQPSASILSSPIENTESIRSDMGGKSEFRTTRGEVLWYDGKDCIYIFEGHESSARTEL